MLNSKFGTVKRIGVGLLAPTDVQVTRAVRNKNVIPVFKGILRFFAVVNASFSVQHRSISFILIKGPSDSGVRVAVR